MLGQFGSDVFSAAMPHACNGFERVNCSQRTTKGARYVYQIAYSPAYLGRHAG